MPRDDDDAQMRAQLALMELERADVDERGVVRDKLYEAHRLRVSGLGWKQIAERLGFRDQRAAMRAVQVYLQQAAALLSEEEKRDSIHMNLTRLETLMHQHWDAALLGDINSANFVLKCITEINRLLGLYEVKEDKTVNKFVVISRESENYVEQLKEIVSAEPKKSPAKQITTGHPDMIE